MKPTEKLLISAAEKSLENAKELLEEAAILKDNKRIPRSYCLYQLAIEEVGKSLFCVLFVIDGAYDDKEKINLFKKNFTSHKAKTYQAGGIDSFIARVVFRKNYNGALNSLIESLKETKQLDELNNYKNYSLYTSIVDNEAKTPAEIITSSNLEKITSKALQRYAATKAFMLIIIKALPGIKDFKKNNPNHSVNPEESVKRFWTDLMK